MTVERVATVGKAGHDNASWPCCSHGVASVKIDISRWRHLWLGGATLFSLVSCVLLLWGVRDIALSLVSINLRRLDGWPVPDSTRLLADFGSSGGPPEVTLACGRLQGAWESGLAAFRGVPYGKAPVGSLRFKPPEPAPCWTEEPLKAAHNGHICYQGGRDASENEDCLNLNVFSPAMHFKDFASGRVQKQLPVIVWIYGGSNVMGSVQSYGSIENVVRRAKGEVMMVAMNYRVQIFGFLALHELSLKDPRGVSGNYGIADQQLALKWIQQNIGAFGGNSKQVTLLGQSSGGTNILALLCSASNKELFHAAISLSGSPNITMDRTTKEATDKELVLASTPCHNSTDVVACLQQMEVHDLFEAMPPSYSLFNTFYDYPNNTDPLGVGARLKPLVYVDGVTISHPLEDALKLGLVDVPLILQSMQGELDLVPSKRLVNATKETLHNFLLEQFKPSFGLKTTLAIETLYWNYTHPHREYLAYALDSDACMTCGMRRLAMAARDGFSSPVYWSVVTGAPETCVRDLTGLRMLFPYHTWDFMAASRLAWTDNSMGKFVEPIARSDLRFGQRLLSDWLQLAQGQKLKPGRGWQPVQSSSGNGSLWGCLVEKQVTRPVMDLKATECNFWESIGVGRQWWWVN